MNHAPGSKLKFVDRQDGKDVEAALKSVAIVRGDGTKIVHEVRDATAQLYIRDADGVLSGSSSLYKTGEVVQLSCEQWGYKIIKTEKVIVGKAGSQIVVELQKEVDPIVSFNIRESGGKNVIDNVSYNPDGSYVFTNPGAMMVWIAAAAAVGLCLVAAGIALLVRTRTKKMPTDPST